MLLYVYKLRGHKIELDIADFTESNRSYTVYLNGKVHTRYRKDDLGYLLRGRQELFLAERDDSYARSKFAESLSALKYEINLAHEKRINELDKKMQTALTGPVVVDEL